VSGFQRRDKVPEIGKCADEPSQSSGEQLELQDELDAQEGFDG
jgi:hypothetical protein